MWLDPTPNPERATCPPLRHLDTTCGVASDLNGGKKHDSGSQQKEEVRRAAATMMLPASSSSSRSRLEARYKELFNVALPQKAKEKQWPISLNHCLMRVALDHYCGRCWYEKWDQRKGALSSMTTDDLGGVIRVAERMLSDGGDGGAGFVGDLHRKSLEHRGKTAGHERLNKEESRQQGEPSSSSQPQQQQQPWWRHRPRPECDHPDDTRFPKESPLTASLHPNLPGQGTVENFITQEEEAAILAWLDGDEGGGHTWRSSTFNGPHRSKRWGVLTDLKLRKLSAAERPIPEVLHPVIRRMRKIQNVACMKDFRPNEANAIEYKRERGGLSRCPLR